MVDIKDFLGDLDRDLEDYKVDLKRDFIQITLNGFIFSFKIC